MSDLRKRASASQRRQQQKPRMRSDLAEVLGVDDNDGAELLRRLASVMELPSQIRTEVDRLPFNGSSFVQNLGTIEGALLRLNFRGTTDEILKLISDSAMRELELCSDMLHQHLSQGTINEPQLKKLRDRVTDLIGNIIDSSLPEDLRAFLLDHLYEIQHAMDMYRIVGLDALQRAVERGAGALVLRPDVHQRVASSGIGKKFLGVLAAAALMAGLAYDSTQLIDRFAPGVLPPVHEENVTDDGDVLDAEIVPEETDSSGGP